MPNLRFDDGTAYAVRIDYVGGTLEVRIGTTDVPPLDPTLSNAIDIPAVLGGRTAFVGFTSATGTGS